MRFLRRRPSPAIVISSVALFMSLGGVGYAATQLPANSVGSYQLRPNAVTYSKIQPGAVGNVRANVRQLQERVWKTCASNTAMNSIGRNGDPSCTPTLPGEFGTTNNGADLSSTSATVTSVALPAGATYLALANPTIAVTSGAVAQRTTVSCTLTVGSNTETRSITIPTDGTAGDVSTQSIPMQAAGGAGTGTLACADSVPTGTAPAAHAVAAINALQTSANS